MDNGRINLKRCQLLRIRKKLEKLAERNPRESPLLRSRKRTRKISRAPFKLLEPTQNDFSPALIEVDNADDHLNIEDETEKNEFLNRTQDSVIDGDEPSTKQATHQQNRLEAVVRGNSSIANIRYCDDFTKERSECAITSSPFRQSLQMIPELNFLHSRIEITTVTNRRLMVMPYVDIGFPDFIQFNTPLPADRIVNGSDYLNLNTTEPNLF
ncbi:Sophorolipid transporter [Trichinella spiralis]|uniref:Sophorolipid transporter n=1 Tax=Trichinella spiralis TaxID=6334 RepID=A0ABR3K8A6_TRISP